MDRNTSIGMGFSIFGALFALFSHFIVLDVTLTSLGLACLIFGITVILIPSNPVPRSEIMRLVEASCVNIEALLEEYDATEKAVYLPPRDGRVYAYVPLGSGLGNLDEIMKAPLRVLTRTRGDPGLFIFTPGSEFTRLHSLNSESGLEEALSLILVDTVEAVESLRALEDLSRVMIHLTNPRVDTIHPRFKSVLGSLPTSLAGSVLTAVKDAPVLLVEEIMAGRILKAEFKVLSANGEA